MSSRARARRLSRVSLGQSFAQWVEGSGFPPPSSWTAPSADRLKFDEEYGVGGPGMRYRGPTRGGVAGGVMGGVARMAAMNEAAGGPGGEGGGALDVAAQAQDALEKKAKVSGPEEAAASGRRRCEATSPRRPSGARIS